MPIGEYNIELNLLIDKVETPVEVPVYMIAKHMTEEQLADFLDEFENKYSNEYAQGQRIGKHIQRIHRTCQGSIIRLLLGILAGVGDTEYFDERNEMGVSACKKIKQMIDDGELKYGYMI
jgi:hypothetical protein